MQMERYKKSLGKPMPVAIINKRTAKHIQINAGLHGLIADAKEVRRHKTLCKQRAQRMQTALVLLLQHLCRHTLASGGCSGNALHDGVPLTLTAKARLKKGNGRHERMSRRCLACFVAICKAAVDDIKIIKHRRKYALADCDEPFPLVLQGAIAGLEALRTCTPTRSLITQTHSGALQFLLRACSTASRTKP
eukprot:gene2343-4549_t